MGTTQIYASADRAASDICLKFTSNVWPSEHHLGMSAIHMQIPPNYIKPGPRLCQRLNLRCFTCLLRRTRTSGRAQDAGVS